VITSPQMSASQLVKPHNTAATQPRTLEACVPGKVAVAKHMQRGLQLQQAAPQEGGADGLGLQQQQQQTCA
jgi:hypothetical protein